MSKWPGEEEALMHEWELDVDVNEVEFLPVDKWKLPKNYTGDQHLVVYWKRAKDFLNKWKNEELTKQSLELNYLKKIKGWDKISTTFKRRGKADLSLELKPDVTPYEKLRDIEEKKRRRLKLKVF